MINHIRHPLAPQIKEFISNSSSHRFEHLAQELFRFQYQHNSAYRRYVEALGFTSTSPSHWSEIPAVPTRAYKVLDHPLTCFPDAPGCVRFLTSGTTSESKGEHLLPATDLYELSLTEAFRQSSLPQLTQLHFLAPSPEELPHSSLSHMFGTLAKKDSHYLLQGEKFSLAPLFRAQEPLFLMGTALAFLHLMESHHSISLPPGSHLMETGGYKGTARELEKSSLYQKLGAFFQIQDQHIHNEYGMTELSSQAYATGTEGAHRFPHWCRASIICPRTGEELPCGEPGYLRLFDLANIYTVAAIQTQDLALMHEDRSFHLIGRDPSALPRGCSRSLDESLSS